MFTVYVDDVTISGDHVPERDIWEVKQMIHGVGLRYHKETTFVDRPAEITGVIASGGKLVAPFRQHKKMHEARIQLASSPNEQKDVLVGRLAGIGGQIRQIAAKN